MKPKDVFEEYLKIVDRISIPDFEYLTAVERLELVKNQDSYSLELAFLCKVYDICTHTFNGLGLELVSRDILINNIKDAMASEGELW